MTLITGSLNYVYAVLQCYKRNILVIIVSVVIFGAGLLGCRQPQPGPIIATTLTFTPTADIVAENIVNPSVAAVLTSLPPGTETPQPSITPTIPTTPSCGPPDDWLVYTILPNDTLIDLANKTETTTSDIKLANCMVGDLINAGESLFLPSIPSPPLVAPGLAQSVVTVCSPFSCARQELPGFPIMAGGPNDPSPCQEDDEEPPWISDWPKPFIPGIRWVGERIYFFACGFSETAVLTATMKGPTGIEPLIFDSASSIPDYRGEDDWPFVVWYGVCDLTPEGGEVTYELTFLDKQSNVSESFTFKLQEAPFETILTKPQFSPLGTSFHVYYCGYDAEETEEIVTDIFYASKRTLTVAGYDYEFEHSDSWTVTLNEEGWAVATVESSPGDSVRSYWIEDRDEDLDGEDQIWLTSP